MNVNAAPERYTAPPLVQPLVRLLRIQGNIRSGQRHLRALACGIWPGGASSEGVPAVRQRYITWSQPAAATEPLAGHLVRLRLAQGVPPVDDAVPIGHLQDEPPLDPQVDLLQTVPDTWLPHSMGVGTLGPVAHVFSMLWRRLPTQLRAWFNALFWSRPQRLYQFLHAPASMSHHHAHIHGLFLHSIDCAVKAARLARDDPHVDMGVLLMAALVHDVAKALEYEWNSTRETWRLSARGELLGHRLGTLEWLSEARHAVPARFQPSETQALALYHAIQACPAPAWVGLREPRTPEAYYLASVDSLSGRTQLLDAHWQRTQTQGKYEPALKRRIYYAAHRQAESEAPRRVA